jgi:hypothetical protein
VSHPDDWARVADERRRGIGHSWNNSPMACFVAGASRYLDVLFKDNGGGREREEGVLEEKMGTSPG